MIAMARKHEHEDEPKAGEKAKAPTYESGEVQHNTDFGEAGERDTSGRFTATSPVLPPPTATKSDVTVESASNEPPPQRSPRPEFPSGEQVHNTPYEKTSADAAPESDAPEEWAEYYVAKTNKRHGSGALSLADQAAKRTLVEILTQYRTVCTGASPDEEDGKHKKGKHTDD